MFLMNVYKTSVTEYLLLYLFVLVFATNMIAFAIVLLLTIL